MKSERLKKLETEFHDLEQWYKLGLVPKKDMTKHLAEMESLKERIEEEKERLRHLKESGDAEEYTMPKRSATKQPFQDSHTIPDIDMEETEIEESTLDMESTSYTTENTNYEFDEPQDERTNYEEEDEDPFSDRNRWRRGVLEDPETNDW